MVSSPSAYAAAKGAIEGEIKYMSLGLRCGIMYNMYIIFFLSIYLSSIYLVREEPWM